MVNVLCNGLLESVIKLVIVHLAAAIICFMGQCHPVLIGHSTPTGQFQLIQREVLSPGYGGDVLQFDSVGDKIYAIHRIWLLDPKQHREQRLNDIDPKEHIITNGCINVSPTVYAELVDCCVDDKLLIEE